MGARIPHGSPEHIETEDAEQLLLVALVTDLSRGIQPERIQRELEEAYGLEADVAQALITGADGLRAYADRPTRERARKRIVGGTGLVSIGLLLTFVSYLGALTGASGGAI